MRRRLFFDHALLPQGWCRSVRVDIADGTLADVAAGASPEAAEHVSGIAVPGLPNLHSHAFQRGMAGMAERRGPQADSFWTWREALYCFVGRLTPVDVLAIAAFAYMEMLEAGFTSVGEFHYLHHDVDGRPYADLGEMANAVAAASSETGIGLTLLPALYVQGGFGGISAGPAQRRFLNDPERFLKLLERCRAIIGKSTAARIGVAPHSLRAVSPEALRAICAAFADGPIHIHAAEQQQEVDQSLAILGQRPVEWLVDHVGIDWRWCVVHATHTTQPERQALAASGAVTGLCPITEASLGDGIFGAVDYLAAGGRFGVGTDSNVQIDAAAELRQLEYSQRLTRHARNVMTTRDGESTGRRLHAEALAGGAQALQQPIGAIAPGRRADIVLLDEQAADFAARYGDAWLDAWIFVAGRAAVKTVIAGGETLVEGGRHRLRPTIEARFKRTIATLVAG